MSDLVSVVITTYNRPEMLKRAVVSVLNQSYNNIEIIVVDDNSDYDIRELISQFSYARFPVVLHINDRNKGACHCRNVGIGLANGRFIAGLDDDDEFVENRIKELVDNYSDQYSFITSNTTVIGKNKKRDLFKNSQKRIISHEDCLWDNVVGTQVLTEKTKLVSAGLFDVSLTSAQDADMWVRLLKVHGPGLRLPISTYLLHTEHDGPRISSSSKKVDGLASFYSKHRNDMSKSQIRYSEFLIEVWRNNRKVRFINLFMLDFHSFKYIFKKKVFGLY